MKRTVCEYCLERRYTKFRDRNGNLKYTYICGVNDLETRRFSDCPMGYTEAGLAEIYSKGEEYDRMRYAEEMAVI